jgi:hypothetical protein
VAYIIPVFENVKNSEKKKKLPDIFLKKTTYSQTMYPDNVLDFFLKHNILESCRYLQHLTHILNFIYLLLDKWKQEI